MLYLYVSRGSRSSGRSKAHSAEVARTWYTRRDQDGRTVIVQVEEGIDEQEMLSNTKGPDKPSNAKAAGQPPKGAPASADHKLALPSWAWASASFNGRSSASQPPAADALADPFKQVLTKHRWYVHPNSSFMRIWELLVLLMHLSF